jgi:arylsulfatase A-like enzyme
MDAHGPYVAGPPYRGTFATGPWRDTASALYDEELLGLDAELGKLLAELERRGVLDRAWLVITSDHGEEFLEHGFYEHGTSVYNTQVRIPLLIHPPSGGFLARRPYAVGLLDVTATLTAVVGAEPLGSGRDLRIPGKAAPVPIEWYGDPGRPPARRTTGRAVVRGRTKLIEMEGSRELYRLGADPFELNDLAGVAAAEVTALAELLPPLTASSGELSSSERELPVDDVERLRALGYAD